MHSTSEMLQTVPGTTLPTLATGTDILVVDDDVAVRSLMETLLEEEGYTVRLAKNGREALEAIHQQRPALVLLDLMMPEMDGWQFLETLQEENGTAVISLPIVLLSASREVAVTARKYNVKAFLTKPFELEKLLSYISEFSLSAIVESEREKD